MDRREFKFQVFAIQLTVFSAFQIIFKGSSWLILLVFLQNLSLKNSSSPEYRKLQRFVEPSVRRGGRNHTLMACVLNVFVRCVCQVCVCVGVTWQRGRVSAAVIPPLGREGVTAKAKD